MGQGGIVTLINATSFDWKRGSQHAYQMTTWNWPETINAGTSVSVYVEFEFKTFPGYEADDAAEVDYTINDGKASTFQVRARSGDNRKHDARVGLTGMALVNNIQGSEIYLTTFTPPPATTNWHVGKFIVSGSPGYYIGTQAPVRWMEALLPFIGNKPLRQICLPGSHDSGMSLLRNSTTFSTEANTKTQTSSIFYQLQSGIRVFDLRCAVSNGKYHTSHFSKVDGVGWQGSFGQTFEEVINEINSFTAMYPASELLIFSLSHAQDLTNVMQDQVSNFTKEQWTSLFQVLQAVKKRCAIIPDLITDASNISLSQYVKTGTSVLFVVENSVADLSGWASQGFIKETQLPYFSNNEWSNTDNVDDLVRRQITFLRQRRPNPNADVCLLQWILTLQGADNVFGRGIIAHTAQCNPRIYQDLWNACSRNTYPNVIMADNCNAELTAVCIAINRFFAA